VVRDKGDDEEQEEKCEFSQLELNTKVNRYKASEGGIGSGRFQQLGGPMPSSIPAIPPSSLLSTLENCRLNLFLYFGRSFGIEGQDDNPAANAFCEVLAVCCEIEINLATLPAHFVRFISHQFLLSCVRLRHLGNLTSALF
jgi:hypothetical protein